MVLNSRIFSDKLHSIQHDIKVYVDVLCVETDEQLSDLAVPPELLDRVLKVRQEIKDIHRELLGASNEISIEHDAVKVGDMVEWEGQFYYGHDSGTNEVVEVFNADGFDWIRLDNEKQFIIRDDPKKNRWKVVKLTQKNVRG